MEFPYTKFKVSIKNFPSELYIPLLDVTFIHGVKNISTKGLLDSGANITLMNKEWAKALGIDWKKGMQSSAYGIIGKPVPIYIHQLEIEINKISNSRKQTNVAFIDSPNIGILLGQIGFFDKFKVTFEYSEKTFQIQ